MTPDQVTEIRKRLKRSDTRERKKALAAKIEKRLNGDEENQAEKPLEPECDG